MRRTAESRPTAPGRGADTLPRLSRPALRLLSALAPGGAAAVPDPTMDDAVIVRQGGGGVSLGRGQHPASALLELRNRDLVAPAVPGRAGPAVISEAGRAHLRRHEAASAADGFAAQHREVASVAILGEDGPERVTVNAGESPLAWLRRRRDRDGAPLIDAAAFEAGERFRRDVTIAGILPSVTARWEGAIGGAGGGAMRDPAAAQDAVIAARQRVRQAMGAVGGDLADLLLDLCGFLKGLETIERERHWPPRSGKIVARLALAQLARHYGLDSEARGPAQSRGVRSWTAEPAEAG